MATWCSTQTATAKIQYLRSLGSHSTIAEIGMIAGVPRQHQAVGEQDEQEHADHVQPAIPQRRLFQVWALNRKDKS